MPKEKLTDRFVATVKAGKQTDYFDTLEPGLTLRVSPSRKTWSLAYTRPGSRLRTRFTIAEYSEEYGLAKARKRARELKAGIDEGKDPQAVKQAAAAAAASALTMRELVEDYITRHVKDLRSADEVSRRLRRNILNETHGLGAVLVPNLHRRDIVKAIDAVEDRGAKTEASRCFEDIRAVVRWAVGRGVLDRDVTLGMKAPQRNNTRDRVLSADEIKGVILSLSTAGLRPGVDDVVRLLFETACRVSEIAGLHTREIDLNAELIRLPTERVKNGLAHNVPLTAPAVAILKRLMVDKKDSYLFPTGEDTCLRADVIGNELNKAQNGIEAGHRRRKRAATIPVAGWTAHDIRRTWATVASELGVAPHVIAAALNHQSVNSSVTFAHYVRNDFMAERRAAYKLVSAHIAGLIGQGAEIKPLRA